MRIPGRRLALALATGAAAALTIAGFAYPLIWAALVALGGLAAAFAAGVAVSTWWERRKLSPDEADKDRLARAVLRLCRRSALTRAASRRREQALYLGRKSDGPERSSVSPTTATSTSTVPAGVRPDAAVTWYIMPRWREAPRGAAPRSARRRAVRAAVAKRCRRAAAPRPRDRGARRQHRRDPRPAPPPRPTTPPALNDPAPASSQIYPLEAAPGERRVYQRRSSQRQVRTVEVPVVAPRSDRSCPVMCTLPGPRRPPRRCR